MPAISYVQTVFVMVMNSLTDFYLMAIPIPMVWKSHLPKTKKITLLIMFSGGLLEMAFGILRCVSILTVCPSPHFPSLSCLELIPPCLQVGDSDPSQSGYWSVRESFVSFVLTNMPMLYPLLRGLLEKLGTTLALTHNGGSGRVASNGQAYRLESYPRNKKTTNKKTTNKDPNPAPEETKYGSNERMVSLDGESRVEVSNNDHEHVSDHALSPFHVAGVFEPARVTVCSGPSSSDVRHPTPSNHANASGIVVTREYNVSEDRRMNHTDQNDRAFLDI